MATKSTAKQPTGLEIRAYNVGFGDCFLLTFLYESGPKNVLIDFGSKPGPQGAPKNHMAAVAKAIEKQCNGRLDAVVASHRHADHISGFTRTKAGDSGDIIRKCAANAVIIQPWTEHPKLATNAKEQFGGAGAKSFAAQMNAMHGYAESIVRMAGAMDDDEIDADTVDPAALAASGGPKTRGTRPKGDSNGEIFGQRIRYMGEDNVKNKPAVDNLMTMSKPAKRKYVFFGSKTGLERVLPGVKVHVLGPPTAKQWPNVQTQKRTDPEEYWHMQNQFWQKMADDSVITGQGGKLFAAKHAIEIPRNWPAESEWFVRRLRGVHAKDLLHSLVMIDKAMNNTSVILLFEVGKKKLLFPGDAQIENWEYCLKHAKDSAAIRKLLAEVDVYKVGHHGSLNATPKTLYNDFKKKARDGDRMTTLISTMEGVHGESKETAVPRSTLVAALKRETNYRTTEKVKLSQLCFKEDVKLP